MIDREEKSAYIFDRPRMAPPRAGRAFRYGKTAGRLGARDWVEIFLFAVIIAFFFKALLFEPSVVPSNSMAPTIYGKTWTDIAGNHFSRDSNDEYLRAMSSSREILEAAGKDLNNYSEEQLVRPHSGDRVIVNKFIYGAWFPGTFIPTVNADWIRLPAIRKIRRGDIVVFTPPEPEDQRQYWVKRVIGMPGETLEIRECRVYINGVLLDERKWFKLGWDAYHDGGCRRPDYGPVYIPEGNYFVMGDNRNSSRDSQYIHVIPERNIRGSVVFRFLPLNRLGFVK